MAGADRGIEVGTRLPRCATDGVAHLTDRRRYGLLGDLGLGPLDGRLNCGTKLVADVTAHGAPVPREASLKIRVALGVVARYRAVGVAHSR